MDVPHDRLRVHPSLLGALGWVVVAVVAAAAAYEAALALGAGTIGPAPGEGVRGEDAVTLLAALAMLVGGPLAAVFAFWPRSAAALLAPAAAAFMVAYFFTYDPYFAPSLRRYSEDGAVAGSWIALVAGLAVGAGVLTRVWPWAGALVSAPIIWLALGTTMFSGSGH